MSSTYGHKKTVYCPVDGCKFHSRTLISFAYYSGRKRGDMNRFQNESKLCPLHRCDLVEMWDKYKLITGSVSSLYGSDFIKDFNNVYKKNTK
jgi:hypothetical protein